MSAQDDMARLRAEADQAKEGMKEFAALVWGFNSALVAEGFKPAEALQLSVTYVAQFMQNAYRGGE
jgi:hypothetical protein